MFNILLIEDDLIDQMAFTRMLEQQDLAYSCTSAISIAEAKELLQKENFDIVVTDYNLADGTTFDLIQDLKNIPFIVITGNEDHATKVAVEQNGAAACFTKDLNLNYLEKIPFVIQNILENKSSFVKPISKNLNTYPLLQDGHVSVTLSRLKNIFEDDKQVLKETIELFLTHKPRELEELRKAIFFNKDCQSAAKITHRMKSGFRIFGMKDQEMMADKIEKASTMTDCQCDSLMDIFKQLSSDTKIAIQLLQKELPLL